MPSAPIALFVYNRPRHAEQTLAALAANALAGESELFVFSDGPRGERDRGAVEEVRRVVRGAAGFKRVEVVEQERNLGLAASVLGGVGRVLAEGGKIVVVEDDLVVSPHFLRYLNDALDRYGGEERVMHVAAYTYPIDPAGLPETFFYRASSCWGWATWSRAWKHLEEDAGALAARFDDASRRRFDVDGHYPFWEQLQRQRRGAIDSWAIRWYASVFLRGGLCLHPSRSLTRNIGCDGTGVHSRRDDVYDVEPSGRPVEAFDGRVEESAEALARIKRFLRPPLIERVRRRLGWRRVPAGAGRG